MKPIKVIVAGASGRMGQTIIKKIISNNDPFVLICRSGRRSGIVANMISKESNAIIYDANGGINSWINADLKVIKP